MFVRVGARVAFGHGAAIRRYRAILNLDSTLADVWLNLGVAYANADREEAARAAWQQTLKYKPGHPTARTYGMCQYL